MKVAYKDFTPIVLSPGGLFSAMELEKLSSVLDRLNKWVATYKIDVINIETVALPNIYAPREQGSEDTNLRVAGETSATWHQFFRVWYFIK